MMETRARFVLIGVVTVLGFVAMLGFVLWLAKVQIDRTYAQYDILFGTVAGLSPTGSVRYNGVDVGTVLAIALDRDDPALVRVRVEVFASTPIRTDTVATLASQGVTGVSFIALEGGSAGAERLRAVPPGELPVIRSETSVVQDLLITGPDLLAEAQALIAEVRGFASDDNRQAIAGILANVEAATGRIDALATRAEATLAAADAALLAVTGAVTSTTGLIARDGPALIADASAAMDSTAAAADALRGVAQGDLPGIAGQLRALITDASRVIATFDALAGQISRDPGRFLLGTGTPEYRSPR